MSQMFFDGWASLGRVAVLSVCGYAAMIVALRLFGQQALMKMSAFDFVATIALGSILASIPLSSSVTATDGLVAILMLLTLQAVTRWTIKHVPGAGQVVKAQPALLVWQGEMLDSSMARLGVTDAEIRAAIRSAGKGSLSDVLAVVLENDGSWSVIGRDAGDDRSALQGLFPPGDSSAE